jgi:L-asparaginase II
VLAEQVRSGLVETLHDGAVAVVGTAGELIAWQRDIDRPFYFRSAAKPFQAAVSVSCGAPLVGEHLALACASHSGDPVHVGLTRSILEAAGLTEDHLRCPPDWPLHREAERRLLRSGHVAPRRIWNNCSGKHAAMLAACVASGWETSTYLDPNHPLQLRITDFMKEVSGPVEPVGVDGCGVPVFRANARAMAGAFARLAIASELAAIWSVMHAYPQLVSGPGRPDAAIAIATNAAAKGGARGTIGVALKGRLGIAVKSWDGSDIVAGLGAVATLHLMGELPSLAEKRLERFLFPPVLGGGTEVGRFEPRLELRWS